MLLWATIVSLLAAVGVQAQERVVDLTPSATSWLKIKNPDYSQAEGRHELLESRRRPALPSRRVKALPPALALRVPRKKY